MDFNERLFRQRNGYECDGGATAYYVAALALAAAGTATSIQGQRYAAKAQEDQQNDLQKANNTVARGQMSQLRIQEAEQREATARDNEKARLATQKAQASATVAAGEAGVSGISVDALLGEYQSQLGQYRDATNRQSQINSAATGAQIDAIRENARYGNLQINAPISQPNYGAEAVKLGGAVLGASKDYNPNAFRRSTKPNGT